MVSKKATQKRILITGVAGFIGFHLTDALLSAGHTVIGVDLVTAYYDVRVKNKRLSLLKKHKGFIFYKKNIAKYAELEAIVKKEKPEEIIHLAAQAGVRYSMIDPWAYAEANYLGTLNVFESARRFKIPRVIYASSSSVYGLNEEQPFREEHRVDYPISLYAATKKANEVLARAYNHLYGIEMVGLRFFTVYGPWGRPDMALFKFVRNILHNKPIELYNRGNMKRSFTYVDDVVNSIVTLVGMKVRNRNELYNLGGSEVVPLTRFVQLIEQHLGKKAKKILRPMQPGDVAETVADCSKAKRDFGYTPRVQVEEGIKRFVDWFLENEVFLLSLKEGKQ